MATSDSPPPTAAAKDDGPAQPRSAQAPDTKATPRTSAPHQGRGVVKRTTSTLKRVLLVAIGAFVALFAVFNSQTVEVRWIFGSPIQTPLILAIAVTFVAGVAIGWLLAKLGGRRSAAAAPNDKPSGSTQA